VPHISLARLATSADLVVPAIPFDPIRYTVVEALVDEFHRHLDYLSVVNAARREHPTEATAKPQTRHLSSAYHWRLQTPDSRPSDGEVNGGRHMPITLSPGPEAGRGKVYLASLWV
jgi:hypothetical protein